MTAQTPGELLSPETRSFLAASTPRYATIATINPDGSPHQIVIWFLLRDDHLVVNSRHGRRWPANLRRDPRASLAVYRAEDAVVLTCSAEMVDDPDQAQADIAEMARRYDAPDMAEREIARFRTEPRVSFILRPQRIHVHGDPR